jgi:PAS domain S-box-containing protein
MLNFTSLETSRRLIVGYGVAVLSVAIAVMSLLLMQARWQAAAPVSMFLLAVIVSTWLGGTKPGLLATALSILGFDYFLLHLGPPLADQPIQLVRLLALGIVACYVVWVTATERGAAESLRRAHDELQRNNEALRVEYIERERSEAALRVSEAKFRALAEHAPAAIFYFQGDKIRYANPAMSVITGYSSEELCEMNFWDIVHPDFRDVARERGLARQRGEAVPPRYEFKIVIKAGEERWLDFTDGMFELQGKPAVVGMALDTTERKRAEDALGESQQLLQLVLATLPVGVAVTNRVGDIILANAASKRIWGDVLIARGPERWAQSKGWWHDSGKSIAPSEWASVRALSAGQTSLNELIDIETYGGQQKTIQNSSAPIRNTDGLIVGAVIVNEDVTERVCAEKALRESAKRLQYLSRRLLTVQEEERRHLSRELHDEFGQLLATITLHLHAAKAVAGEAAQSSLDESMALLQRAAAQVRSLALELRPTMLETGGLETTLRWLAEQHQQRTGIPTQVLGHVSAVSGDPAIAAFRVAQEALTNVVRHARAQRVWIELSQRDGLLELVVRDDGVGFDVRQTLERAAGAGNLGLLGMKERVEILGGALEIDSQPGQGTRIRISLPLAEPIAVLDGHAA